MSTNQIDRTAAPISIQQLRADLKGRVIAPGDDDYDRARTVMYGGIDRRPAVIVNDPTNLFRLNQNIPPSVPGA